MHIHSPVKLWKLEQARTVSPLSLEDVLQTTGDVIREYMPTHYRKEAVQKQIKDTAIDENGLLYKVVMDTDIVDWLIQQHFDRDPTKRPNYTTITLSIVLKPTVDMLKQLCDAIESTKKGKTTYQVQKMTDNPRLVTNVFKQIYELSMSHNGESGLLSLEEAQKTVIDTVQKLNQSESISRHKRKLHDYIKRRVTQIIQQDWIAAIHQGQIIKQLTSMYSYSDIESMSDPQLFATIQTLTTVNEFKSLTYQGTTPAQRRKREGFLWRAASILGIGTAGTVVGLHHLTDGASTDAVTRPITERVIKKLKEEREHAIEEMPPLILSTDPPTPSAILTPETPTAEQHTEQQETQQEEFKIERFMDLLGPIAQEAYKGRQERIQFDLAFREKLAQLRKLWFKHQYINETPHFYDKHTQSWIPWTDENFYNPAYIPELQSPEESKLVRSVGFLILADDARLNPEDPNQRVPRSDVIRYVLVDPITNEIFMMDFPRDIAVPQGGKINAVIGTGEDYNTGAQHIADVVEQTGLSADYIFHLSLPALMGGYEQTPNGAFNLVTPSLLDLVLSTIYADREDKRLLVSVPKTIEDNAYPTIDYRTERIVFEQGSQLMDAGELLKYMRTRHQDGDTGRRERQQQVIMTLLIEILKQIVPELMQEKDVQTLHGLVNAIRLHEEAGTMHFGPYNNPSQGLASRLEPTARYIDQLTPQQRKDLALILMVPLLSEVMDQDGGTTIERILGSLETLRSKVTNEYPPVDGGGIHDGRGWVYYIDGKNPDTTAPSKFGNHPDYWKAYADLIRKYLADQARTQAMRTNNTAEYWENVLTSLQGDKYPKYAT